MSRESRTNRRNRLFRQARLLRGRSRAFLKAVHLNVRHNMRRLLYLMSLLFVIGGIFAIALPRAVSVSHPAPDYSGADFNTEHMSEQRSVTYGFISLGFGAIALIGAWSCNRWYTSYREMIAPQLVPNQLPDPTSPSVTPPASAGGAPSVAADH